MTIEQILSAVPEKGQKIAHALTKAGLQCVGCGAATWETLEAGMYGHGFAEGDIDRLEQELNEIVNAPMETGTISMTKKAAQKFLSILEADNKAGWALRFGDKPGGCGGYEYILDFSKKADADDEVLESHGVQIHVKKNALQRLMGSEIDYQDGLQGAGFKVSNPNVKSSCSCGSSQNYAG